ncbi:alpha/beta fold hydrolase [Streptomyces flaveolus]|uniref:Alpha/beta fold hydrolase n=1 Tax=Streptomyces flaveolus TaxID=67297 RepID=A0ABV1VJ97_9ACTN
MATREDVEFEAEAGVTLRGWFYHPEGEGPYPAITMAHGFAGVKEQRLAQFAEVFAEAGFAVLVHDHRNFGASDGTPRNDIDPWQQIKDWRRAISYLESRPEVDAARIGLWGTSYAGGHALVLGATDRRLRCVVAQVPTISGFEQGRRRVAPDAVAALNEVFAEDERAQFRGEAPRTQAVVGSDPAIAASYRAPDAVDFYLSTAPEGWDNEITIRSNQAARMYEPGAWISRISPTPLLMIVAKNDPVTITDLILTGYEQALEPKRLQLLEGGHFAAYLSEFDTSSAAARDWFELHLA